MAEQALAATLAALLADGEGALIAGWLTVLRENRDTRISDQEVEAQAREFSRALARAVALGNVTDIDGSNFEEVRGVLAGFSRGRALQGFSASETATFVLSMKQPLFAEVRIRSKAAAAVAEQTWALSLLLDKLGLFTIATYQKTREELIVRQREE